MGITSDIQFVEDMFSIGTEGPNGVLTALFMGKLIPKAKWKLYMSFWNTVIWKAEKSLKKAIKEMLRAWLGTHFFELLVEIFSWVVDVLTALETEPCNIETSRDPPKIFIPIPKIESNGCARSDSLICSLIFYNSPDSFYIAQWLIL
ncbi:hypothetical protein AVDCRST_MAG84-7430 [uncultured Microcoleus sp.]|uniref:Uncharacterized protein n=1 Tax=uncultured Microcoleus sp. TaxID=259945 RepID=A0A6J4PUQ9_9CYAN|nr:hypothetical protein AVDCRST_MAG84-7430 [uncultured Microcoleus sp.]